MSLEGEPGNANRYERSIKTFLENSKENSDFIERCFWELKGKFDDYGKRMSKWIIFGLALVCIFELLNRHLVSKASISGIDISRLDFLLYAIPPAVAFSFLNLATFNLEQNIYGAMVSELAKQHFSGLNKSSITSLLLSQQGLFPANLPKALVSARAELANQLNLSVQFLFVPICYTSFEIHAYIELFGHSRTSRIGAVISLIITACLFTIAVMSLFNEEALWQKEP